jgi:hypothetical protein
MWACPDGKGAHAGDALYPAVDGAAWVAHCGLDWALSVIGVLIFAGLTAWDTQKIKGNVRQSG